MHIFLRQSPHKFSNTDPSNLIISRLTHFKQTLKTTYSTTQKTFFTVFQISPDFKGTPLNPEILMNNYLNRSTCLDNTSSLMKLFQESLERKF